MEPAESSTKALGTAAGRGGGKIQGHVRGREHKINSIRFHGKLSTVQRRIDEVRKSRTCQRLALRVVVKKLPRHGGGVRYISAGIAVGCIGIEVL